jgi:hypothetical protein
VLIAHQHFKVLVLSFVTYYGLYLMTMNIFLFVYYYCSGYGSSPPYSQMDREHSSRTSAKALYGMYGYVMGAVYV